MNRTSIEYCDYTWNPVVGCEHGCSYCYARRFAERGVGEYGNYVRGERFHPRFFPERLAEPAKLKRPSTIFVCSMGDLFGEWVPDEWIEEVIERAEMYGQHDYLFLTKNPTGYIGWGFPSNCWLGTTLDTSETSSNRSGVLSHEVDHPNKWISAEPLLDDICAWELYLSGISAAIIGAQTGPGAAVPKAEWAGKIIARCEETDTKFFLKGNLPENLRELWGQHPLHGLPWEVSA